MDETWLLPIARKKCYKVNEVAPILWDTIPCINMPTCEEIQVLLESKWNKNCEGVWRRDLGKDTFGLKDKDNV